jgi:hypothetical protein
VVFALLFATSALAGDPTASMPPDIAAIIAKMKAGGRPTADDLAKLKAWQRGVVDRANAPTVPGQGPAQPEGIPCKVRVSLDYTSKQGSGTTTGHIDGYTDATLYAKLGGDGDYYQNVLNPDAPASSFRFMPILPPGATARPAIGGGSAHMDATHPGNGSSSRVQGSVSHVAFGALLTTTGKGDMLWGAGSITGNVDGTRVNRDPSGTRTAAVHDTDFGSANSGLSAPFVEEERHPVQSGKPTPAPTMKLSYKALADAVRSGKSATVTGSESFSFTDNGTTVTGTTSITITLRPKPFDLVVEPADDKLFQDWLPMPDPDDKSGGAKPEYFGHLKPLAIHVALHDTSKGPAKSPGPTKPSADVGGQIAVRLLEVSTYPGMAMDYPARSAANTKPDLYFPNHQPDGIVWVDESHVHTAGSNAVEATVWVAARDTGAYGKVEASIESLGAISYDPRSKSTTMTIPLDENNNHIADGWERSNDIYELNRKEDWDDEDKPDHMAGKGDSLALIDEYRGFVLGEEGKQPTFQRLSPKTKKLFVIPRGPDLAVFRDGAVRFGAVTGITMLFTRTDFAEPWQHGLSMIRWINFNETPWTHPATAVRIEDKGERADLTGGGPGLTHFIDETKANHGEPMTPQDTEWVNVSRKMSDKFVGDILYAMTDPTRGNVIDAAARAGIDLAKMAANAKASRPLLVREVIVFTTMHELGHATGGVHHAVKAFLATPNGTKEDSYYSSGDKSCPMRYWPEDADPTGKLLFLNGQWFPSTNAPGGAPWRFCTDVDDDWGHMRLK